MCNQALPIKLDWLILNSNCKFSRADHNRKKHSSKVSKIVAPISHQHVNVKNTINKSSL